MSREISSASSVEETLRHPVRLVWVAAAFLSAAALALYFRTYSLQASTESSRQKMYDQAEQTVVENMRRQLAAQFPEELEEKAGPEKEKLVDERLQSIISREYDKYLASVDGLFRQMEDARRLHLSARYLTGADSYYYYHLTKNLAENGRLGPSAEGGTFINPLRRAPAGSHDHVSWHPYVGLWTGRAVQVLGLAGSFMQAVAYTPLVLTLLTLLAFFALAHSLDADLLSVWIASLVLMLAPVALQRSTFGWYDTDPYNLLFPILVLATLTWALRHPSAAGWLGFAGGLVTGIYVQFWHGWLFIFLLTAFSSLVLGVLGRTGRVRGVEQHNAQLIFFAAYTLTSGLAIVLLLSPEVLLLSIRNGLSYFSGSRGASSEVWPNMMIMIDEAGSVSLKKWIFLTSSYIVAGIAVFAGIPAGIRYWAEEKKVRFSQWLAVVMIFAALFVFSLSAERFALLAVIPMSILLVFALEWLQRILRAGLGKVHHAVHRLLPVKIQHALIGVFMAGLILPRTLAGAHVTASSTPIIMDDQWAAVLETLQEKTPEDTIVYTWWPPGYFVNAMAERAVVMDGGTPLDREHFWLAIALMSRSETLSCGLFRMLGTSGNRPSLFLTQRGMDMDSAVALILKAVIQTREEALRLLPEAWSEEEKKEFLDMTHGTWPPRPGTVLVYNDLVDKNIILQVLSGWNFSRAARIQAEEKPGNPVVDLFSSRKIREYARNMFRISGEVMHYNHDLPLAERRGALLVFKGGVTVDLAAKQAFFPVQQGDETRMEPLSLFYRDGNGWWVEAPVQNSRLPYSVILLQQDETYKAATAQNGLVRSLLFRLFYFDGQDLELMKHTASAGGHFQTSYIRAYEIDWDGFAGKLRQKENGGISAPKTSDSES